MLIFIEDSRLEELKKILDSMDIPTGRKSFNPDNFRWLLRNIGIRNSKHNQFKRAVEILKELIK